MRSDERRLWLVCYDVTDDRRLRRVYRTMRGFGDHVQYSVFRCLLSNRQRKRLEASLLEIVNADEDQVLFVPMGRLDGSTDRGTYTIGLPLTHPERLCHVF